MKVIQLVPALNAGGVERGTLELGQYLTQLGHESVVISGGGRLVEQLKREGSTHIEMPIGAKRLTSLRHITALRAQIAKLKPDIVHVRSRVPAWLTWLAWRKLPESTRPHLISTVHGFYSVNRYSRIMTCGERVIAVSESVKRYIHANYPRTPADNIRVIHRGVSPEIYAYDSQPPDEWLTNWRDKHRRLANKFIITLPARITRWKGQEHFINVIDTLKQSGIPVHGLLVGDPHARKRKFFAHLKQQTAVRGLTDDITFLGHRTDLANIMRVSDVVISLSTDPEAFGRVTLEALSLGRPVAGYDHGGVHEQLAELLPAGAVPIGDWQAMADLLRKWYPTPPRPSRDNPFTLQRMLEKTVAVYQELLSPKRESGQGGIRTRGSG